MNERQGPLANLKVLEFAGIGPVPFCGMLLSDLGADVVRIDRPGTSYDRFAIEARGRRPIALDLKSPEGRETALALADKSAILIEGFRPGVMERLGLGPDVIHRRNRRLVYGRMTGWGQTGPYAGLGGHDINYVALTGALHGIGTQAQPVPPLNLIGDFGGGALYLAFGLLAALRHAEATGEGQVIDCAMTDGTIGLMSLLYGHLARGTWQDERGVNIIDGGSHFYNVYQCADGQWIAFGSIEPPFYGVLLEGLGIKASDLPEQMDAAGWPRLKERIAQVVATRPRAEWLACFAGKDACVTPVLSMSDAPNDPHNCAREAFVTLDDVTQPAPAPRFSRTPGRIQHGPATADAATHAQVLNDWGVS